MSELKIFKDMEANCANCPFDITEGDIKRCYDDCGDKPNECYECSYLEYYLKSDADKVIAKKDAEIAELKAKLENVQASMYADVVDVNMDNRRLKRALWLARAERAYAEAKYNNQTARRYEEHKENTIAKCFDAEVHKWKNVRRKCRAMAEEYVEGK